MVISDCYGDMVGCWALVVYRGIGCRVSDVDTHLNGNSLITAAIGLRLQYVHMYGVDIRFWFFSFSCILYNKMSLYVLTSSGGGGVIDDGTHQSSMVLRVLVYSIGWVCMDV